MEDKNGLLTFSIGVTGHRDIAPEAFAVVRERVTDQLSSFGQRFKHTQIELICGVAEGADTIVAQAALDLGIKVRAILPMPPKTYEEDFSVGGSKTLRKLIKDPNVTVEVLPLQSKEPVDRDRQYALLKDYLVRRSNILLALWDNKVTGLLGGTSDVVLEYLAQDSAGKYLTENLSVHRASRSASDVDDGNLVIAISTPRQGSKKTVDEISVGFLVSEGGPGVIAVLPEIPEKIAERWIGLDQYAKDKNSPVYSSITCWDLREEGDSEYADELFQLNQEFIRADQLAIGNQGRSDILFKGFGIMAGAMGLFFLIYAKLAALKIYLIAYLVLFAAGYFLFRIGKSHAWFSKHLAYRAYAEALRVRYYLILSGCSGNVRNGPLLKMTKVSRFRGIEWLTDAIKCAEPLVANRESSEGLELIRVRWIDDQSQYFAKKMHDLHKEHSRLEKIKGWLFVGSFIGVLALVLFKKEIYHTELFGFDGKTLLVFFMGLLPLWLALWELYQGKMAIRELTWQYSNQGRIFFEASRRMGELTDTVSRNAIVSGLAESSLAEIFQWTVHRFHREHEPPTAG